MPIYAIIQIDNFTQQIIQESFDLSQFSFFARGNIKNIIREAVSKVCKRIKPDSKMSEIHEELNGSTKVKLFTRQNSKYRIAIVADGEYSSGVAFKLMNECFLNSSSFQDLIKEYKDWEGKDLPDQINKELAKCNIVMIEGLSAILERGETLSDLVAKSENLNSQTKMLFKAAKKRNQCC